MSDTLSRAKKLFELGGHLGHRKSRLHPKARSFVYDIIDGTSVIDLEQTIAQLDNALKVVADAAKNGQSTLVVATKKSVAQSVQTLAKEAGAHFITTKWLPGLLTNYDTIAKNTKKLVELKRQKEVGEWAKFVKHEQVSLEKQVRKLEKLYGGVVNMHRLPDLLVVVDIKREKNAVTEAHKNKIPVVAIVDTNCNPNDVQFPIILNDDAPAAVMSVFEELIESYKKNIKKEAQKDVEKQPEASQKPKEVEVAKPKQSHSPAVAKEVEEEKVEEVDTTSKKPAKKVVKVAKQPKKKSSTKGK